MMLEAGDGEEEKDKTWTHDDSHIMTFFWVGNCGIFSTDPSFFLALTFKMPKKLISVGTTTPPRSGRRSSHSCIAHFGPWEHRPLEIGIAFFGGHGGVMALIYI
jgi:hypothetical protein